MGPATPTARTCSTAGRVRTLFRQVQRGAEPSGFVPLSCVCRLLGTVITVPVGRHRYFGSPLFVRTALVEPPPNVEAAALPTVSKAKSSLAAASATSTPAPTAPSTPAATATVALQALAGRFVGADDFHFARGQARLIETEPGRFTVRLENFSVRNGPDLYVYLSPDPRGYARAAVELGRLRRPTARSTTRCRPE